MPPFDCEGVHATDRNDSGSARKAGNVGATLEVVSRLVDLGVVAAEDHLADALLGADIDAGEELLHRIALLGDAREADAHLAGVADLGLALEREEQVLE